VNTLLDRILAPGALRTVFQPVFDLHRGDAVHGVECLTRGPVATNAANAAVLFEYVRRKRAEVAVDRACILSAFSTARGLPPGSRLSVNVHATSIVRDPLFLTYFTEAADACGIDLDRITLELVEHSPALDGVSFSTTIADLRSLGVRIALDDVGVGSSNLRMMLDCRPDYLKIDRYFVSNCDQDDGRLAVIDTVAQLARRLGAQVVAEGIERVEELQALAASGVHLVQGWLFAPALEPAELARRYPAPAFVRPVEAA
jgi:EAL domain-containing protein (putative c-di-GMP-specific phosphodiesterase class I)